MITALVSLISLTWIVAKRLRARNPVLPHDPFPY